MDDDRKVDALLRLHYKVDPAKLSDRKRLELWSEYVYTRQAEREFQLGIFRQVLSEAFPPTKS